MVSATSSPPPGYPSRCPLRQHEAFAATDGEDPDWAIWYADYLHDRLGPFLAAPITRSRLVFCLVAIAEEHETAGPAAPWTEFYAARILECLGPAERPGEDKLALYHSERCPYCSRVRRVIEKLGIDVELRDIFESSTYLKEINEARSRRTVPVLRIIGAGGEERWMPESADIVRCLEATYGQAAAGQPTVLGRTSSADTSTLEKPRHS